jgi:6-hydroxycyclohex-1-ene-1-carbonyl-CoA dehydrogenase
MGANLKIHAWQMVEPGKPLAETTIDAPAPGPGEAVVEVAGCGLCHTDIGFHLQGVKTRKDPPITLGHEISGVVQAIGEGVDSALEGKAVLVPAVLPCGECAVCKAGHRRICRRQVMPGNDRDGGFASHVVVPARWLCPVPDSLLSGPNAHELWELSIISDAVTTPFQAVRRSGLAEGDLAVCIGVGGIGIHGVQIAAAAGAKVIALDVDPDKLDVAAAHGAGAVLDVKGVDFKTLRKRVQEEAKNLGAPPVCWRIFETSGTKPGQETAFGLLGPGATLAVVGFTMEKLEVRLSNLMAFDASAFGIWGCDPVLYPEVLDWIARGGVQVKPFVEKHALSEINDVVDAAHHGKLKKRAVLVP